MKYRGRVTGRVGSKGAPKASGGVPVASRAAAGANRSRPWKVLDSKVAGRPSSGRTL